MGRHIRQDANGLQLAGASVYSNDNTSQQSTASATANPVYSHHIHCLFTYCAALNTRHLVPGMPTSMEVAVLNNERNMDAVNQENSDRVQVIY